MKKKILIFAGIFLAVFASKSIRENVLIVGDGNTTDKQFIFDIGQGSNNPRFIWDSTNLKLKFTNDNTNLFDIGSGGGGAGGINMLANADFENGASDWVASGTSVALQETAPINVGLGQKSLSFNANANGETLSSVNVNVAEYQVITGQTCLLEGYYKGGSNALSAEAWNGSTALASVQFSSTASYTKFSKAFPCPSSGTLQLRITATADATLVYLDQMFLGAPSKSQGSDQFVGNGGAGDKSIIFDGGNSATDAQIKFNDTTKKITATHDGSNYFDLGDDKNNYIKNKDFTTTINVTMAQTTITTELLGNGYTYKFNSTGTATTSDKASIFFKLPRGKQQVQQKLSFMFEKSTGFADDDIEVVLVNDPNGTPTVVSQNVTLLKDVLIFETPFIPNNDATKLEYALEFRVKTPAKAIEFFVGELKVSGENNGRNINILSEKILDEPSGGWFSGLITNVDVVAKEIRENNRVKVQFKLTRTAPSIAFGSFKFKMPYNLTNSKNLIAHNLHVGSGNFYKSGSFTYSVLAVYRSTNEIAISAVNSSGSNIAIDNVLWNGGSNPIVYLETTWIYPDKYQGASGVNLLDEQVVNANARLKLYHATNQTIPSATEGALKPDGVDTNFSTSGINFNSTTGILTVKTSGVYNIIIRARASTLINPQTTERLRFNRVLPTPKVVHEESFYTSEINRKIAFAEYLSKDETYEIKYNNTRPVSLTFGSNDPELTSYTFIKVPNITAGSPIGFGVASNGNYGLVDVQEYAPVFTASASMGAGGGVELSGYRVGKMVTLKIILKMGAGGIASDIVVPLPTSLQNPLGDPWVARLTFNFNSALRVDLRVQTANNLAIHLRNPTTGAVVAWPNSADITYNATFLLD